MSRIITPEVKKNIINAFKKEMTYDEWFAIGFAKGFIKVGLEDKDKNETN